MAVLVLLGPPGAGKGTWAGRLEERFALVQLSTGDLLRDAVARGAEAGQAARSVIGAGGLVSDDIVVVLPSDRMADPDCTARVIPDGFRRTRAQAEAPDGRFAGRGAGVNAANSLDVDDAAMVERMSGRDAWDGCGEGYHVTVERPEVGGVCAKCDATEFRRRVDDPLRCDIGIAAVQRNLPEADIRGQVIAKDSVRPSAACAQEFSPADEVAVRHERLSFLARPTADF